MRELYVTTVFPLRVTLGRSTLAPPAGHNRNGMAFLNIAARSTQVFESKIFKCIVKQFWQQKPYQ